MTASARLRELDAAATPGPWGVYEDVEMSGGEPYPFHRLTNAKGWLMSLDASDLRLPDARLMATLRSALPLIADVVEAAEMLTVEANELHAPEYPSTLKSYRAAHAALTALQENLEGPTC